nr:MAG TPA: hypothetical protein [Caudoviricetes sp.]
MKSLFLNFAAFNLAVKVLVSSQAGTTSRLTGNNSSGFSKSKPLKLSSQHLSSLSSCGSPSIY